MEGTLLQRVNQAVVLAAEVVAGGPLAADVEAIGNRLNRPLRVAIAGRAKAGKSTLLNALVGEPLAATDATECTRIVTWYRHDLGYSVTAQLRNGQRRPLEFTRAGGLEIRLGDLGVEEIERIDVGWPSSRLASLTLIDTPGLDSATAASSARTLEALVGDEAGAGEADAVLYLMRHLHRRDAEFLEAFEGSSVGPGSPVTAVAVLSRADEIGAGRPDAMESAIAIAARYAADPILGGLASSVLPVSGLLAAAGGSLREADVAALRQVAALDPRNRRALLLSVDRFREREPHPLAAEVRADLLARLGLFGVRLAVQGLVERPGLGASELARRLAAASGIQVLDAVIGRRFADRADALKARSALARLRAVAAAARAAGLDGDRLLGAIERSESSSPELAQLRLLHLVQANIARLTDQQRMEAVQLLDGGSLAERLGQPIGTKVTALETAALAVIERWRTRAGSTVADPRTAEVAEGLAHAAEAIYQQLSRAAAAAR